MATAAITGTITNNVRESGIVAGGKTIIITVSGDVFVASGATFNAERQNIIDGITSVSSQANGWNNTVASDLGVGDVARTSDTVCTITLPISTGYDISSREVVEVNLPASCLTASLVDTLASNTFQISPDTTGNRSRIRTKAR